MPRPGDVAGVARYVVQQAPRYNLDPNAVIAVATQEGLLTKGGAPGDNGTSFGPWQLHQGGAYPSNAPQQADAANTWAWSDAGIDYALGRMSSVAGGLKGRQAVRAIVYRFERPADPAKEYAGAVNALPASDGGSGQVHNIVTDVLEPAVAGQVAGGVSTVKTLAGIPGDVSGVASFLGHLTDPKYLLRGLEIMAGIMFVLFGLYLLGRAAGAVDRASGAAGKVAAALPETRAVAPALQARAEAGRQRRTEAKARRQRQRELDAKYGAEAPF